MPSKITITVAGANGNLAVRIIKLLLNTPHVQVRGYARSPQKIPATILNHERFTAVKGEAVDPIKAREAVQGASVVICCYQGYDEIMVDGQKTLIDACEAEGVDRYFASDYSLDFRKLEPGQHEGKDCMKKIAAYLEGKRVKAVHIMIGCFIETWLGYLNVWDPSAKKISFWGTGNEPWEVTSFDNCAEYTVAAALEPQAVGYLSFCGDTGSTRDIAATIEKVYGIRTALECRGTLDELYDFMQAEKAKNAGGNKWTYMVWFYQYYGLNGQTYIGPKFDNERYPQIKPITMEEFIKKHNIFDDASRQFPI